jgi:hypothetical protein
VLLVISTQHDHPLGVVLVKPSLEQSGTSCGYTITALGLSTLMHQISRRNGAAMAQKVQILFIDDLDGSEADGTVRFGSTVATMRST